MGAHEGRRSVNHYGRGRMAGQRALAGRPSDAEGGTHMDVEAGHAQPEVFEGFDWSGRW
jgi:hypothetical protein